MQSVTQNGGKVDESPLGKDTSSSTRNALSTTALVATVLGVNLCYVGYGRQFWGNWLHSWSFNVGLVSIALATAVMIGLGSARKTGFIVGATLLGIIVLVLWTYPGWLLLHYLIRSIVT